MATKLLSELIPDVMLECPGCIRQLVLRELQKSSRVLFRRSGVWRTNLDPITTVTGITDYELIMPDETNLVHILDGYHNDKEIFQKSQLWLNSHSPHWKTIAGTQIRYFTLKSNEIITVTPIPSELSAISLDLRVSLTNTVDATSINEDMYDDWYEVILAGAKARLMRMADKSWTSPDGAIMYGSLYSKGIVAAKIRGNKDNTTQSLQVKPRFFA